MGWIKNNNFLFLNKSMFFFYQNLHVTESFKWTNLTFFQFWKYNFQISWICDTVNTQKHTT